MENQPNQAPKAGNKALWVVLIIVILVIAGYAVYAYVSGNANNTNNANAAGNSNLATNTNTQANANSAINSNGNANVAVNSNTNTSGNTNIDTSGWKTYENTNYGYSFKYPKTWRIAEDYMRAFAEIRHPQNKDLIADYVVITKLSNSEENNFIAYAKQYVGIAARPWYDFGRGNSIIIVASNLTLDDYKEEVSQGTNIVIPSNIREETLSSGQIITRLNRYEKNDNGEFTYEVALFPVTDENFKFIEVRIEKNNGNYELNVFDNLLNTIKI